MAIDIDHSTQSIMATGDPFVDGYLSISAPGGGAITIDGALVCTQNVEIGGVTWPAAAEIANATGSILYIAEYPAEGGGGKYIGLKDLVWDDVQDKPIFADVAVSGSFNDLTDKPLVFSGSYNDLTGKPTLATVATSGSYNDLTDKPAGGGSVDYADVTNTPVLASVATSGSYVDLSNKPALAAVALSGNYEDLVGAPVGGGGLVDYADITNKPTLATVATSGSYNDLTDKPVGGGPVDYADITNKPTLATVATSGDYADLTNKPTIPTVPTLATVATSGSYLDLTNRPTDQVGIAEVAADLSPTLGGDLEVGDKVIKADSGILQLKTAGNGGFPGGMVYVDGSRMVFSNIDAVGSGRYHPVTSDPISEVTIAVEDGVSDIRLFATGGNIVLDPGLKAVQIGGNGYVSGLPGYNLWLSTIGPGALILGGSQDGVSTAPDILVSSPVKFVGTASITHSDTNQGIAIDGNGTGRVVISGQSFPKTDGSDGQVLTTDGDGNLSWTTVSGGGTVDYADVTNTPTLATVATSGAYADLSGKPTLATVATSGDYADLDNTPTLATVATSGAYADLTDKPTLFSGAYNDLTGKPTLATVATSGAYSDLTGTPPTVPQTETLTYGATVTADWAGTDVIYLTLDGNTTLTNSGAVDGQKLLLCVKQDATGGRTLAFGAETRFGTDLASITLSTAAGKQDKIGMIYDGPSGKYDVVAFLKGF